MLGVMDNLAAGDLLLHNIGIVQQLVGIPELTGGMN